MMNRSRLWLAVVVVISVMTPGAAWAHGMGWQADGSHTVVVRFAYDDGGPMAGGEVMVYSPEGENAFHSGRTDRNGYFVFRPDAAGQWRFTGDDGQGHVTRGTVDVKDADLTGGGAAPRAVAQGGAHKPNMFQILLGLSVLVNIGLINVWLRTKRRTAEERR